MKKSQTKLTFAIGLSSLMILASGGIASGLQAASQTTTKDSKASGGTSSSTVSSSDDQVRITAIINAGNREISRRLTTLNSLASKISGAAKLSASDKASLTSEVTTEISALTALKTKLDAETTLDGAKADVQSMVQDYRVYALIVPKVQLIRVADDQQVVETKLTTLAGKLQTRINDAKTAGKDVTSLQAKLDDLNTQVAAAQAISSKIESDVINLQPSDYDSNHAVLSGDAAQLKTAHSDNTAAYEDAKSIVNSLKSL